VTNAGQLFQSRLFTFQVGGAAIAEANACTVVTANEKGFAGIENVNP
jgi:hypothetical protein